MKRLNEGALIAALCNRDQDARDIKKIFNADWLRDAELKPVLRAIYEHMDNRKGQVPSLKSLAEFMQEKDEEKFNVRWKGTLLALEGVDTKLQSKAVQDAKDVAAAYSFNYLMNENRIQQMIADCDGEGLRNEMSAWLSRHTQTEDEGLYSIQEAFDKLITEYPWRGRDMRIKTGLKPIDEWSGGLRPNQLGIIIAPTGHGKSATLMNAAWYTAAVEGKRTLFISNELSVDEQSERFMVRMQDPRTGADGKLKYVDIGEVQEDPTLAYKNLEQGHMKQLTKNLMIYSAGLNQTAAAMDELCQRLKFERGFFPEVIIIDYMERMGTVEPVDRKQTWTFYGQIARELIWLARRRRAVVWTAAQTNRAGLKSDIEIGLEHMQGSIQHAQEAAYAVTIRRKKVTLTDGTEQSCLEFHEHKSRFGAMENRKMLVKVDLSRMYISDEEAESIKEIEEDDNEQTMPNGNSPAPLNVEKKQWTGGKNKKRNR